MADLNDNLIAWWKFDEAAGNNRADSSPNGHTFVEVGGTVPSTTGHVGNAATGGSTGPARTLETGTFPARGSAWTLAGWFNPRAVSGQVHIPIRRANDFTIRWDDGGSPYRFWFFSKQASGAEPHATVSVSTADVWHFVVCEYDGANSRIRIRVDQGSWSSQAISGSPVSSTGAVVFAGVGSTWTYDRSIDSTGIWSRLLDDAELDVLWNNGAGQAFPFPPIMGAAVSTWVVPGPSRAGKQKPTAASSQWTVPAVNAGAAKPTAASSQWTVPAVRAAGAKPTAAASTWIVPAPVLVGLEPNNLIKFGRQALRSGGVTGEALA